MKALGATIREIRKHKGYTITHVHYESRMGHKSIVSIERGAINPKLDQILNLCRVLDVKPSTLFAMVDSRL